MKTTAVPLQNRNTSAALGMALFLVLAIVALTLYSFGFKPMRVANNLAKLDKTFSGHAGVVWEVKFSPDGTLLASGSLDSTVKVWQKNTGKILLNLEHPTGITAVEFSPDGKFLATSGYDGKIRLWQLTTGHLVKEFPGHRGTVWSLAFGAGGNLLASSGEDAKIKIWQVKQGNLVRTLAGHKLNIWSVKFSPDGSKLASGSFDRTIKLWQVNTGTLLKTIKGHSQAVLAVSFTPDGQKLVSGSDDTTVKLWNLPEGSLNRTFRAGPEHVHAVAVSPDNKRLVSGTRDHNTMGEFLQNLVGVNQAHKGITVRLWDLQSGELLQTFAQHQDDVFDVAYSPDGSCIASASEDKTVQLWQIRN